MLTFFSAECRYINSNCKGNISFRCSFNRGHSVIIYLQNSRFIIPYNLFFNVKRAVRITQPAPNIIPVAVFYSFLSTVISPPSASPHYPSVSATNMFLCSLIILQTCYFSTFCLWKPSVIYLSLKPVFYIIIMPQLRFSRIKTEEMGVVIHPQQREERRHQVYLRDHPYLLVEV